MAKFTTRQVELIVSGLKLLCELLGGLDKELLERALTHKLSAPHVTRVPDWEETKSFIEANPDFVSSEEFRKWWDSREQTQNRVRLMIALARERRRSEGEGFCLFAPEVRDTPALPPAVMSVADEMRKLLDDPTMSEKKGAERIMKTLEGAQK
jgi:hypothetical protein